MTNKVQSQLLVSLVTRQRADALAVVLGEPRAEIYRKALEGAGLAGLEAQHREALDGLRSEAQRLSSGLISIDTRKGMKALDNFQAAAEHALKPFDDLQDALERKMNPVTKAAERFKASLPWSDFLTFAERVAKDGYTLADLREMSTYPEVSKD